jgi:hypothetical protein
MQASAEVLGAGGGDRQGLCGGGAGQGVRGPPRVLRGPESLHGMMIQPRPWRVGNETEVSEVSEEEAEVE